MIRIDTRLLDLIPKIGADAFGILCLLCRKMDAEGKCCPSRKTLQEESGFGRDKLDKAIKSLKENNLISILQGKNPNGGLSTNIYTIHTLNCQKGEVA
jgi:hypothetical protein